MLIGEYLEQEGYYYAPTKSGHHLSTSDIAEQEIIHLEPEWVPCAARFDPNMVNTLISVFNDFVGDAHLPNEIGENYFRVKRFEQQQSNPTVEYDADVSALISSSFLSALFFVNTQIQSRLIARAEGQVARNTRSRVDIVLTDHPERRALLELKNPSIIDEVKRLLQGPFKLAVKAGARTCGRKVINKLALYMASYHVQWAALSCHNDWIFFRLYRGVQGRNAYLTFSSVVSLLPLQCQDNRSRTEPLRTFLGMLVATARDIDVPSGANLDEALEPIPEDEYEDSDNDTGGSAGDASQDNSDESYRSPEGGSSDGPNEASAESSAERPSGSRVLRPRKRPGVPDILLSWSLDVTPADKWLKFYAARNLNSVNFPLSSGPVRLRLQRVIGAGSTSCVYEAKIVGEAEGNGLQGQTYALKVVSKGSTGEERDRVARLIEETRIYASIEDARLKGSLINAVPRCYGLYETNHTLALVLDYAGEPLPELEWHKLEAHERENIFEAVKEIHGLGISHNDFDPRNVVRASDRTFKIIDFTAGKFHRCRGVGNAKGLKCHAKGGKGCPELRWIYRKLLVL